MDKQTELFEDFMKRLMPHVSLAGVSSPIGKIYRTPEAQNAQIIWREAVKSVTSTPPTPPAPAISDYKFDNSKYPPLNWNIARGKNADVSTPPAEQIEAMAFPDLEFEKWAKGKKYDLFSHTGKGYNSRRTATAWYGWRAAKASGAEHVRGLVSAVVEISMRAGQLASGDYKACGHIPEEMGVEILHIVKHATDKLPEHLKTR